MVLYWHDYYSCKKKNSYLSWYILETYPLTAVRAKTSRTRLHCFTAKFIVLHLCVCKVEMGFSVSSIIWVGVGLMQLAMQHVRPAWHAKTKLRKTVTAQEYRRKLRWWVLFLLRAGGRHCFIFAIGDKNKKDPKELWRTLVYYCPKQGNHKQRTLMVLLHDTICNGDF